MAEVWVLLFKFLENHENGQKKWESQVLNTSQIGRLNNIIPVIFEFTEIFTLARNKDFWLG